MEPTEIPPARAEPWDEPTARAAYPNRVRRIRNQTTTAATTARMNSQDRCAPGRTPKSLPMSPTSADLGNWSVRRSTFCPGGAFLNFSGKLIAHARKLIAMPFIMIVVTTSWAPVFTFRMPGTAAQIMPPSIATIRITTTCTGPGRKSKVSAAQAAATMATRY